MTYNLNLYLNYFYSYIWLLPERREPFSRPFSRLFIKNGLKVNIFSIVLK